MSESLTVELNGESVHAIDAPGEFTAQGPFFVELRNVGGPVHVHLHLDDDLSRAARLDAGNHFVEGETAKRVPVGVVRGSRPVTGRLEVVTGHGTETSYVTVTVVPDSPDGDESIDSAPTADRVDDAANASSADDAGRAGGTDSGASASSEAASAGSDAATRVGTDDTSTAGKSGGTTVRRRRTAASRPSDRAASAVSDAVSTVTSLADVVSRDGVAFVALAGVAVAVGLAVITTAQDAFLGLVVVGVAAAVLAAAGWLLLR